MLSHTRDVKPDLASEIKRSASIQMFVSLKKMMLFFSAAIITSRFLSVVSRKDSASMGS